MESHRITQAASGALHIEGFPDAAKVIRVEGPLARRLSDLALHRGDLEFADECLNLVNTTPSPGVIRDALWRSAIVHFLKCFGDSGARFHLSASKILKGEAAEAMWAFSYFKSLRNKHVVHDENSCTQSIPGAVLNKGDKSYKIEKVVCFAAVTDTLVQENYSNLKLLIAKTRSWVVAEFDRLCDTVVAELEKEPYEKLFAKESMAYRAPTIDEVHQDRNSP